MAKSLERLLVKADELAKKIQRVKEKERAASNQRRAKDQQGLGELVYSWAQSDPKIATWLLEQASERGCTKPQMKRLLALSEEAQAS